MLLDRRELVRFGALAVGGAFLSSSASSSTLPSFVYAPPAGSPDPLAPLVQAPQPAIVTPSAPGGINPELFAKAKAALDTHRIHARDTMAVVDFSLPSSEPRFHVVGQRRGPDVEAQLDRRRHLVDVLPARAGCTDESFFDVRFVEHVSSAGSR